MYSAFINTQGDCDGSNGDDGYCHPWHGAHSIQWIDGSDLKQTNNRSHIEPIFLAECDGSTYSDNLNCDVNESNFENFLVIKDHNFYEGIGKYNLFFAGWDDTKEGTCLNSNSNGNITPCSRWVDSSGNALSPNKVYYQDVLRTKANKNFDKAENALTVIFVNHVVSVFDIFISNIVKRANNNLDFESNAIYDLNNKSGIGGVNFNLKW